MTNVHAPAVLFVRTPVLVASKKFDYLKMAIVREAQGTWRGSMKAANRPSCAQPFNLPSPSLRNVSLDTSP